MLVIVRKTSYHGDALRTELFGMMDALGGKAIGKGCRVLIKPNLLSPALPGHAVVTHASLVRAAVEYCNGQGVRPLVADSPAIGSFDQILRKSGLRDALAGLDCQCRPFETSVPVDIGEPFGTVEIAEEAARADVIVNLPKLKTHSQMLLTLAVKNLFGCVIGYRKPEWHMRAGIDRDVFAGLIAGIGRTLRPAFNILDGILALEGQGPGRGGSPRELGFLLACSDPFALDRAVCRMLDLDPQELPVLKAAGRMGFPAAEAEIDGTLPVIGDFRFPRIAPVIHGPQSLHGLIRRQLLQRPRCHAEACRLCGECWKICPARAIAPDRKPLRFDYERCIRCWCCLEVCPFGAIGTVDPLAGRIVRRAAALILPAGKRR